MRRHTYLVPAHARVWAPPGLKGGLLNNQDRPEERIPTRDSQDSARMCGVLEYGESKVEGLEWGRVYEQLDPIYVSGSAASSCPADSGLMNLAWVFLLRWRGHKNTSLASDS